MDSSERPEEIGGEAAETSGDYSYDMAHEVPPETDVHHPAHRGRGSRPRPVDAPPPDPDGDYSYDLAHEVPRAEQ